MKDYYLLYISLMIITGLSLGCNEDQSTNSKGGEVESAENIQQLTPSDLIGKTIEYSYGESVYHVTIDTENEMHWEAVAGDEKGAFEEETYGIASTGPQQFLITWSEANGIGVSQVLDFEKGIVYNHLIRGRNVSTGTGKIRILE